jgi:hypothetical protein
MLAWIQDLYRIDARAKDVAERGVARQQPDRTRVRGPVGAT